jgi:heme O synthase-like polyprenyltransferase
MYQYSWKSEGELLEVKNNSRKHIIYGVVLLLIVPVCLFFLLNTLVGSIVIVIIATPSLGAWFLYDGIKGYKKYRQMKKEYDSVDHFT